MNCSLLCLSSGSHVWFCPHTNPKAELRISPIPPKECTCKMVVLGRTAFAFFVGRKPEGVDMPQSKEYKIHIWLAGPQTSSLPPLSQGLLSWMFFYVHPASTFHCSGFSPGNIKFSIMQIDLAKPHFLSQLFKPMSLLLLSKQRVLQLPRSDLLMRSYVLFWHTLLLLPQHNY